MPRSQITHDGVLKAISEFNELGRKAFLERYGFNRARDYFLVYDGKNYDSKAIAAVAHKWAPDGDGRSLTALELSGGRQDAVRRLQDLGFTVTAPTQNADWSWDEHVLALDLYMINPTSPPGKQSQEVVALSRLLALMGAHNGASMRDKFRNANGVYMKMMNFRRFDPAFQAQGKGGLGRGSKGEEAVWERFASDRAGLRQAAEAIRSGYAAAAPYEKPSTSMPSLVPYFVTAFDRFKRLVAANQKGEPFTSFSEGVVAAHEAYKPRLRRRALELLGSEAWEAAAIGSGQILECVIPAIEIAEDRINLTNNLVFWQNRYGHANRDHRALLEASEKPSRRQQIEKALFDLYRGDVEPEISFESLSGLTGAKYPLLAYLFYLKDDVHYLPIQPTAFDQAFKELGIELTTLRNCDWENYRRYNSALSAVPAELAAQRGLSRVELIDAHTFCWLLVKLPSSKDAINRMADPGRIGSARAKAIINMRLSIQSTARNSNGQQVTRNLKNKNLLIDSRELDALLERLMKLGGDRCALTGIRFEFDGDPNLMPSPDRIDSNGHYSDENIQIVCRFVNFWKSDSDDSEFKRLLQMVRGNDL